MIGQVSDRQVDRVKIYWLVAPLHSHSVDTSKKFLVFECHQIGQLATYQNVGSKLLGGCLQSAGHIDIWRQIASVNFEL